jgi:hypothetical protein
MGINQCAKCPWRKSTNPLEIPGGYNETKHASLVKTIANAGAYQPERAWMACHESGVANPYLCAGWLHNQLGDGNNIALRIAAVNGKIPRFSVDGEQHSCLRDTLPTAAHRGKPLTGRPAKNSFGYEARPQLPGLRCGECAHFRLDSAGHSYRGKCDLGQFGVTARGVCAKAEARSAY